MAEYIYNPEFVKGLFNRMSSSYERMNFITSFGFSIRWRRQFLKQLQPSNDKVEIIDLLTGMGETWHMVKRKFPNAHLYALDFSEEMLKNAKSKNEKYFNNEVTILQQDILQNELLSNHFDFVICAFGLKTFNEEQLATLAIQTRRILKTGGQFSFVDVSKPEQNMLQPFYKFYLRRIIPVLGNLFLGTPMEYKMLWKYTEQFENAKIAKVIFEHVGFKVNFHSYFYGCATGFYGSK